MSIVSVENLFGTLANLARWLFFQGITDGDTTDGFITC
jgi:hypothetical protein